MPVASLNNGSSSIDSLATGTTAPSSGTITSARRFLPDPSSSLATYVIQTTIDGAPTAIVISNSSLSGGTLGVPSSSSTSDKSSKLPLIITALATTTGVLLLIGLGLFLRRRRRKLSTSSIVPFQSERRLSPSTDREVVTQGHTPAAEASVSQLKASIFPAEKMPADRPETQPPERSIPIRTVATFSLPTVLTQRPGASGADASWEDAQVLMSLDTPPSYESVRPQSYSQS